MRAPAGAWVRIMSSDTAATPAAIAVPIAPRHNIVVAARPRFPVEASSCPAVRPPSTASLMRTRAATSLSGRERPAISETGVTAIRLLMIGRPNSSEISALTHSSLPSRERAKRRIPI